MQLDKKLLLESLFIVIVFAILLWISIGANYEHKLDHSFPRGFMAGDSFYKYNRAYHLDKTGENKYVPETMTGGVAGLSQFYPYLVFHSTVLFNNIAGLNLYNSHFLLKVLYTILAALLFYVIVRRYNKNVALLSTGIFGFLFIKNFYIGFIFGWEPQILGSLFFVSIFWIMMHYENKYFGILLGIMMGALLLTHPPEAFLAVFVVALFLIGHYFIDKKIKTKSDNTLKSRFEFIKKTIIAVLITIVIIFYYSPVFAGQFLRGGGGGEPIISWGHKSPGFPVPLFSDFGFFGWFIILGAIIAAILLFTNIKKHWKHFIMPLFMGIMTFSVLFMSIQRNRVYQNRFFWPIYFGILFGLAIYMVIKYIPTKKPQIVYMIIPMVFLMISASFFFTPLTSPGLIPAQEMWDGIVWVRENIPQDDTVLVFYGDSYNQHAIFSMFDHLIIYTDLNYLPLNGGGYDISDSISKVENNEITRNYTARLFTHDHLFQKRISFINIEEVDIWDNLGYDQEIRDAKGFKQYDLCSFDYVIIDKISRIQPLMMYNLKLRETLINNTHVQEVFSNPWYSILNNQKPSEECI